MSFSLKEQNRITLSSVSMDTGILEKAGELEQALATQDLQAFCEAKVSLPSFFS